MLSTIKSYDIFISYVVEDREIVEALYEELTDNGLRVWYARKELQAGVEIRPLVERGLKSARYGIVLISPRYNSHWAQGELFVLIADKKRFLPILHEISLEQASGIHPGLIDVYCLETGSGLESVLASILKTIKPKPTLYYGLAKVINFIGKKVNKILLAFLIVAFIAISLTLYRSVRPPDATIERAIIDRAEEMQNGVQNELQNSLIQNNGSLSTMDQINREQKAAYLTYDIHNHRNKVNFSNGFESISSIAGLINAGIFLSASQVEPPFGLHDSRPYLFKDDKEDSLQKLTYAIYNMAPLHYKVIENTVKDGIYEVKVQYSNPLRYVEVNIQYDVSSHTRHRQIKMKGLKALETMVFERQGNHWAVIAVH